MTKKDKVEKSVSRKIKTRTHLVALTKTIAEALGEGYEINHLIDWVKVFFSGKNGTSVDAIYNLNAGKDARRVKNINQRRPII